jgi:hypothetical protein
MVIFTSRRRCLAAMSVVKRIARWRHLGDAQAAVLPQLHRAALGELDLQARAGAGLQLVAGLQRHAGRNRRGAAGAFQPGGHLHALDDRGRLGERLAARDERGGCKREVRERFHFLSPLLSVLAALSSAATSAWYLSGVILTSR